MISEGVKRKWLGPGRLEMWIGLDYAECWESGERMQDVWRMRAKRGLAGRLWWHFTEKEIVERRMLYHRIAKRLFRE